MISVLISHHIVPETEKQLMKTCWIKNRKENYEKKGQYLCKNKQWRFYTISYVGCGGGGWKCSTCTNKTNRNALPSCAVFTELNFYYAVLKFNTILLSAIYATWRKKRIQKEVDLSKYVPLAVIQADPINVALMGLVENINY